MKINTTIFYWCDASDKYFTYLRALEKKDPKEPILHSFSHKRFRNLQVKKCLYFGFARDTFVYIREQNNEIKQMALWGAHFIFNIDEKRASNKISSKLISFLIYL